MLMLFNLPKHHKLLEQLDYGFVLPCLLLVIANLNIVTLLLFIHFSSFTKKQKKLNQCIVDLSSTKIKKAYTIKEGIQCTLHTYNILLQNKLK